MKNKISTAEKLFLSAVLVTHPHAGLENFAIIAKNIAIKLDFEKELILYKKELMPLNTGHAISDKKKDYGNKINK